MTESKRVWEPSPHHVDEAQVLHLARRLGLTSYDELYRLSLADPQSYWRAVIDQTNFVWSKPPTSLVDVGAGDPFPTWFPGGELNWVDTFLAHASDEASGGRTAIVSLREDGTVTSLTYEQMAEQVRKFAAGLRQRGLRRGDRVGLICENGSEAIVTILAVSYLGCIVVPLFSGFGSEPIVSRLSQCGARAVVATTGFDRRGRSVDRQQTVMEALESLEQVELVIWKATDKHPAPEGGLTWSEVASAPALQEPAERMNPNDPFLIMYTSGTTGKPKGVVHIHGGFPLKTVHDATVNWDIRSGDTFFWPADLGWVAGPISVCATLLRGATMVCYDGAPDFPDWSRMSRIIEAYRVTHFVAAPTLIRGMAANSDIATRGDVSTVRLLITAGEGIDPEHFWWFQDNFAPPGTPVVNSAGGTEASCNLLSSVIVKPIRAELFNTASPAVAVDAVDGEGKSITGQVAELAIRGPFVGMAKSFWEDDERYLESYWKKIPGMWIHGDLVRKLETGEYQILGRSDDTMKLAGKRMGPAEIEQIVLDIEGVQEAAAVGVDDPVKGQTLVVLVVLGAGAAEPEQISTLVTEQIGQRLGRAFRPSQVQVVSQLPKTATSKIMRRLIRQIYSDLPLGDLSSLDNPLALDEVRRVAQKQSQ